MKYAKVYVEKKLAKKDLEIDAREFLSILQSLWLLKFCYRQLLLSIYFQQVYTQFQDVRNHQKTLTKQLIDEYGSQFKKTKTKVGDTMFKITSSSSETKSSESSISYYFIN